MNKPSNIEFKSIIKQFIKWKYTLVCTTVVLWYSTKGNTMTIFLCMIQENIHLFEQPSEAGIKDDLVSNMKKYIPVHRNQSSIVII